jgi:integrase
MSAVLARSPGEFCGCAVQLSASLLIAQGESLAYVRDQLGHASIQLTVDTYGHLIPGANRQAVDRLDDATIRNPAATGEIAEAQ